MTADILLQKLDGVRQRGVGSWIARCPAHDDNTPSLSVRETDDGVVLVRCFVGCETPDVLSAVALEFCDLFPTLPAGKHRGRASKRPRLNGWDVVRALQFSITVIAIFAEQLLQGGTVSEDDAEAFKKNIERVQYLLGEARRVR